MMSQVFHIDSSDGAACMYDVVRDVAHNCIRCLHYDNCITVPPVLCPRKYKLVSDIVDFFYSTQLTNVIKYELESVTLLFALEKTHISHCIIRVETVHTTPIQPSVTRKRKRGK